MILKGSKRGGAMQMARHLLNPDQNEHVKVHEVSGFMSEHVSDALAVHVFVVSVAIRRRESAR